MKRGEVESKKFLLQGGVSGASAADAGLASRLLQALRWRLVRSRPGPDRWGVLTTWIEVDLLHCHGPGDSGTSILQVRDQAYKINNILHPRS